MNDNQPEKIVTPCVLVAVVSDREKLEEIIEGFIEIGITGATIIDTYGMAGIVRSRIPIFTGFREFSSSGHNANQTIFSVIDDEDKVRKAFILLEDICGNFDTPASGIAFTIPIGIVNGLAQEIE